MLSLYTNVKLCLARCKFEPLSDNASYVEQAIMLDCEGIVAKQSAEPIQLVWLNSSLAQLHGATYIRGFHNQALLIEGCIETAALRARCVGQVTTMYVQTRPPQECPCNDCKSLNVFGKVNSWDKHRQTKSE